MNENLLRYAKVNSRGSILLGENTVADGYEHGRDIGIFTHIHTDHTRLFNMALHECSSIYLSPPTYDLLEALEGTKTNPFQHTAILMGGTSTDWTSTGH